MIINNIERARRAMFSALGFIALLLCGAALLGLGLAESAEGAGIRTGSAPAQILPDAVADEGGAPEMVADTAASSAPFDMDVIMGELVNCDEQGLDVIWNTEERRVDCVPPTSSRPAPAASAAQSVSTMTVDFQDDISKYEDGYHDSDICKDLGGVVQEAGVNNNYEVCSGIDKIDTFCIVGHTVAFPCQGLFKHVRLCNGGYNRPARDISFCASKCSDDKFACGDGCESGGLVGPVRIPYVAPGYLGEVFLATLTMGLGKGRVSVLAASGFDARAYQAAGKIATVHILSPLPTDSTSLSEHAVTLRAGFSCAGRTQKFGMLEFVYTITSSPPMPPVVRLTREWLASTYFDTLDMDTPELGNLEFLLLEDEVDDESPVLVDTDGMVGYRAPLPVFDPHRFTVELTSPERYFLGTIRVMVEIAFDGPPNASRMPLDCRAPDSYPVARERGGCIRSSSECDLDTRLVSAVLSGDTGMACALVTMGANVNYAVSDDYLGVSKPILFDAIERGDAAMVSILAYNGANVNYRLVVSDGVVISNTPLHVLAAHSADSNLGAELEKIAQALVENGADVNARNARDETYLYLAASGGNASGMRAVLRAGADPNLRIADRREGDTQDFANFALVKAAEKDLVEVVSILIDFKDEVSLNVREERRGLGALHLSKSRAVVELLV